MERRSVSTLEGDELDYWIKRALGWDGQEPGWWPDMIYCSGIHDMYSGDFSPSTVKAFSEAIIDIHGIDRSKGTLDALRSFVASHYGEFVGD